MNFKSHETVRQHQADLIECYNKELIPQPLMHFIVNYRDNKFRYPMISLAHQINKDWASTGLLDLHDLSQIFYKHLIHAYNNVDWEKLSKVDNKDSRLWKYLKKSIMFNVRHDINRYKDGMKLPRHQQWKDSQKQDDFFSIPKNQIWFWLNDEEIGLKNDTIDQWDNDQLNHGLGEVMRLHLSDTERLVLEFYYGIDGPKKPQKDIAKFFSKTVSWVKVTKHRAINKLKTEDIKKYLENL